MPWICSASGCRNKTYRRDRLCEVHRESNRGKHHRKFPRTRLRAKTPVCNIPWHKAVSGKTRRADHLQKSASPEVFQEYENVLVEEFGSMRGLCKMADLHSLFTRCHSLMQALKDSAQPGTAIMLPKVCAASVVALLFWGISTSSRFLDDEDTDRFKAMLARRRKLRIKDVQVFQCHWLMATNMIGQGEGGLLSE